MRPAARPLVTLAALALSALSPPRLAAQPPPAGEPVDLVLLVDVSTSMFAPLNGEPTDPDGIRWDGIQFLIDTAGPDDRVALVLYRGDVVLVTKYLDDSGFVTLGTGPESKRHALKKMVAGFRQFERDFARNGKKGDPNGYPIPGQAESLNFRVYGTASLPALGAVWSGAWDLQFPKPGHRAWVMLFTDGMDEWPFAAKPDRDVPADRWVVWPSGRFGYLAGIGKEWQRGKSSLAAPSDAVRRELRDEAARTAAPFRDRGIPVFTFGIQPKGMPEYEKAVMRETLAPLSKESLTKLGDDHRYARIEAARTAGNNLELLGQLQDLGWELRERWQVRESRAGGPYRFATPDRELCRDLGVLLYQEAPGRGATVARAPLPMKTVADGERLESPSHHYVRFPADGKGPGDVVTDFPGPGIAHAIVGMELKAPSVRLVPPDRVFTPIDAVPIVVRFDPRGNATLRREMFSVTAQVQEPEGKKTRGARRLELRPVDSPTTPGGWEFRADLIPDDGRRPDSPATPGLEGDWLVDVEVAAAKDSPLRGATRRLLRTRYAVGPYPAVAAPRGGVGVSNLGDLAGRGTAVFALEPRPSFPADRDLASLAVEFVPADEAAWKGLQVPALPRAAVRNGEAAVSLDLTSGFDWAAVPKGGLKGKLRARVPWSETPAECDVTIKKEPYPVNVGGELVFDLSGEAASDSLTVGLETRLATTERVIVSAAKDSVSDELVVADGNEKVALKLAGAAKAGVSGGRGGDVPVRVERAKDQKIKPGEYTGTIHLLPADGGTKPASVPVRVLVNQPVLKVGGVPSPRVRLVMLAGTREALPLEVSVEGPAAKAISSASAGGVRPLQLQSGDDPADRIRIPPEALRPGNRPGRFTLAVEVPRSIRDGRYTTELVFDAKAEATGGGAAVPFTVRRALEVEVRRFAVTADTDSPVYSPGPADFRRLRERHPDFPGHDAALPINLTATFADKDAVVRWWAKVVPAGGPAAAEADPLDRWFDGRIEVLELGAAGPGQSVLGKDARPLPVSKSSEQKLVVVTHKLGDLPPGLHRCKVRVYGTLDPHPKGVRADTPDDAGAEPPHYDLPIEVLVRGRTVVAERAGNAVQVTVTGFGCGTGSGQLRSPDVQGPPIPVGGGAQVSPGDKPVKFAPTPVNPGPGLTRYVVDWPKRVTDSTLPDLEPRTEDVIRREVRFWEKPRVVADRTVTAPGDKVTLRISVTPATFDVLRRPVVAKLTRRGAADGQEVRFTEDPANRELTASFQMPSDAGVYDARLLQPLVVADRLGVPADARGLEPDPVVIQVGLEVQKTDRPIGPLVFGGGFFSSDSASEPGVARITNNTNGEIRYTVRVLYPRNLPDSRTITAHDLAALPLGDFDPTLHLEFKPTTTEGTIKPGATAEIGVDVGLSADALDAYLNDREHRTLKAKNGSVVVVKVDGVGPEGQKFEWELRHPMVVETQSWHSRGLWYGLVGGVVGVVGVAYGLRRWRAWSRRVHRDPRLSGGPVQTGNGGVARDEPPPPEDELPPQTSLFGGPPP